jgi:hypothetical protein
MKPTRRMWTAFITIVIVGVLASTSPGRGLAQQFFASLRIAKPQPVSVTVPSFSGPNANRQLQDAVSGMIADKVNVTLDEADQPVTSADAAGKAAGFVARLPRGRKDSPTLIVMGAHAVALTVNLAQLKTIFAEAGKPDVALPKSVDGAAITVKSPRAIRAQYGNCPAPPAATIQNQIQGPPPPSTDNGSCIVLTQSPAAVVDVPHALDTDQLVEIGLELSGMSPIQTQAFQKTLDWKSTLVLSMPRSIRSYDMVDVNGRPGMLLNTGGRRGPTYALIWSDNGVVYSLTGYGSPGDALPLAKSIN